MSGETTGEGGRFARDEGPDALAAANPFTGSVSERLAQAMAELEAVEKGVAEAEAQLRAASQTVRSRDRSVEVTVGAQGELTGLKFLEGKYRTMSAGELAAAVLESATEARDMMARRVMRTFEPFTRPSTTVPELKGVDVDWARIFGPGVLEDEEAPGHRRSDGRLRDEISEDQEEGYHHG